MIKRTGRTQSKLERRTRSRGEREEIAVCYSRQQNRRNREEGLEQKRRPPRNSAMLQNERLAKMGGLLSIKGYQEMREAL